MEIPKKKNTEIFETLFDGLEGIRRSVPQAIIQSGPLDPGNLTLKQLDCVKIVDEWEEESGLTLKELAYQLKITPASASSMVDKLVRQGMFQRVQNPEDRRQVHIKLTKEGRRHIDSFISSLDQYIDTLCEQIPAELLEAADQFGQFIEAYNKNHSNNQ